MIIDLVVPQWLISKGASKMEGYLVEVFMEELSIAQYLLAEPCSRGAQPYLASVNGWASG